jgi:hypothetical protein
VKRGRGDGKLRGRETIGKEKDRGDGKVRGKEGNKRKM